MSETLQGEALPSAAVEKVKPQKKINFPVYRNGALHTRRLYAPSIEEAVGLARKQFAREAKDHYFELKTPEGRFRPVF